MGDERQAEQKIKKLLEELEACVPQHRDSQKHYDKILHLDQPVQDQIRIALAAFIKRVLAPYDLYLTVQEGFFTAVDGLIFFFNREAHNISGIIVIERPEGKYAPLGGFTRYGETPVQTVIREAAEEAEVAVAGHTLRLVGVYGEPERDPRPEHIVSLAYAGLTADWPRPTEEAHRSTVMNRDALKATHADDWFCTDHREMALKAYDEVEKNFEAMLKAFYHEE